MYHPDLAVALSSSDSATVSWTTGGTETAWEYVLQPQGTGAPAAAGTPTSSNQLTLSGLSSGTAYEIYLRADCGAGDLSPWTGPANFETGPACGDTIYDSGGASGDYSNNELITTTVFPDNPGDVVTFTFLSFDTESCCDGLTVYNGPDTSSDPVDDEFRGTTIPNPITSTDPSGALTFVFDSDGSITGAGYEILISCGPPLTLITDANFSQAIQTCLSTNPIDGMCSDSEYGAMPDWDVSQVTNMSDAFNERTNFNADIIAWDVSSVINMARLFHEVQHLTLI